MQVTVEVPESLALQVAKAGDVSRQLLESAVLERYRAGLISRGRLAELLALSFWQSEEFLRLHGVEGSYSEEDFDADVTALGRACT